MRVDLKELRDRAQDLLVKHEFSEAELELGSDMLTLEQAADCTMTVSLRGDRVRVVGAVDAKVQLNCCRCLRPFTQEIHKQFDLAYEPDPVIETEGEEIALSYGDLGVGFYRNEELDLAPIVGEQILLELAMKPVCREDCQGLCPHCGADLNQGLCNCEPETVDPRLAVLLRLKKRMTD